jgi:predicted transcriptional regulator
MDRPGERPTWTFLTHHARVLILIARDPGIRLRDVATACDITERTVQGIVADLEDAGYLTHTREGRRNRYSVIPGTRFRHPAEAGREIAGLFALINDGSIPGDQALDDFAPTAPSPAPATGSPARED